MENTHHNSSNTNIKRKHYKARFAEILELGNPYEIGKVLLEEKWDKDIFPTYHDNYNILETCTSSLDLFRVIYFWLMEFDTMNSRYEGWYDIVDITKNELVRGYCMAMADVNFNVGLKDFIIEIEGNI
jgi:hypothetical protein